MDYQDSGFLPFHGKFLVIPNLDRDNLLLSTFNEEIRRAVFSMAPMMCSRYVF